MKIAILSDTHNLLRPEVIKITQGADYILHGCDENITGIDGQTGCAYNVFRRMR